MAQLTQQEEIFLNRMAIKMADDPGLSMEDAGRAVIADDQRIRDQIKRMDSYDRRAFSGRLAQHIFVRIHTRLEAAA